MSFKLLYLFLVITCLNAYASDCDLIEVIPNPPIRELMLKGKKGTSYKGDPQYYEKRNLNIEVACHLLTEFKRLYPSSLSGETEITYRLHWDDFLDKASAGYDLKQGKYTIELYGGKFDKDQDGNSYNFEAHITSLCHEVGHIRGGTLESRVIDSFYKKIFNKSEALSDYFASHKCLKRVLIETDLLKDSPPLIKRISSECAGDQDCVNILNAGYELYNVFAQKAKDWKAAPDFNKMSSSIANTRDYLFNEYPEFDCRFDSFIAGYKCSENNEYPCGLKAGGFVLRDQITDATPPRCFYPWDNSIKRINQSPFSKPGAGKTIGTDQDLQIKSH